MSKKQREKGEKAQSKRVKNERAAKDAAKKLSDWKRGKV